MISSIQSFMFHEEKHPKFKTGQSIYYREECASFWLLYSSLSGWQVPKVWVKENSTHRVLEKSKHAYFWDASPALPKGDMHLATLRLWHWGLWEILHKLGRKFRKQEGWWVGGVFWIASIKGTEKLKGAVCWGGRRPWGSCGRKATDGII